MFKPDEAPQLVIVGGFALAVVLAGVLVVNHDIRMTEGRDKEVPHYGLVLCGGPLLGVNGCVVVITYLGGGACF